MGIFRRAVDRSEVDAPKEQVPAGVRSIAGVGDRERAVVQGRVTSLTLPTVVATPDLEVELADRTGQLQLIFTGRRAIPGIDCGTTLRVSGRVSSQGTRRVMYNPAYEIVPGREH